ncbi:MAG: hypothetical protein JWN04_534 [Myxococcaceae bacterium]|nr:hypothetical protein [Myxococcaceae bacterium]
MNLRSRMSVQRVFLWACLLSGSGCTYDWSLRADTGVELPDASDDSAVSDGGVAHHDAAPDGSRSDARGALDEGKPIPLTCDDCAPTAVCDAAGLRLCTCPAGTNDEHGNGTLCVNPCLTAACDANAQCSVMNGTAKCTCNPAYVGDGTNCTFDSSCSQLSCDANASCAPSGTTRSCKCNAGYQGDGITCTNIIECNLSSSLCGSNGTCVDNPGSYSCSCSPGFSGPKCDVDVCNPSPCGAGFSCQRGSAGATCVPACAPNCVPGSACTADNQCSTGSTCNPQGKVCVTTTCGGGTISFQTDINRLKYCASVGGSLVIDRTPSTITDWSLPYLKTITGGLTSSPTIMGNVDTPSITFEALEAIGGDLELGNLQGPQTISMPQLKTVGGTMVLGMCSFVSADFGHLTSVGKDLQLVALGEAGNINIPMLQSVKGAVTAYALSLVPWYSISQLATLGTSQSISTVGCSICPNTPLTAYGCGTSTCK